MESLGTRSRKATEADRRHSLDAMLAYICEVDHNEAPVSYCAEQELKLPQAPFGNYNVSKTKADGVIYLDVAKFRPYVTHSDMAIAATAFCEEGPGEVLQIVHCVAKFEREEDGSHQAMMAMVSGLYQRRVLQMPGQFVFGVFHFRRIHFRVVAGVWQGDTIQLYEIGQYSIIIPMQAIQLYLVLRGIHRLGTSYLDELQWSTLDLASRIMAHPPPSVWLPVRVGSIQENLNEPHQGGGNTQQETPEQRHARRKVASYLQSISFEHLYHRTA
ncbi:unnamed protein product [Rhizoctonia solani]|uniref:Uncharacterized protein n=1 Tax=Rhizoctonia solani TaxID=456999 RepID=A0A8H3CR35_9AGAM|nr:unnamed protein product [Rhizoctonia solani]